MLDHTTLGLICHLADHQVVAGVDEVGRGSWAGPVEVGISVARVGELRRMLAKPGAFAELNDSKRLSGSARERLVGSWPDVFEVRIGSASATECDQLGMTEALRLAGGRALEHFGQPIDLVLLDGSHNYLRMKNVITVAKGDTMCAPIALAAVTAKVHRDHVMAELAVALPQWGFERHKGYGSRSHEQALLDHGLSRIHRRSWGYVSRLGLTPV